MRRIRDFKTRLDSNRFAKYSRRFNQQFSQIVKSSRERSTIFSFFTKENFFFEINTLNESSNTLENDAIFTLNSNFDFLDTLKIVNNETQRTLDRHSKLRFKRVFFVDFLIDLIVFFKISFVNSYESKIYKQTMIDIYHKMK